MTKETFGNRLNTLRKQRNLTVHQLAKLAGVHKSLISGLNTDSRVIGEYNARKIGNALQLDGNELDNFIYLAINQCSEKILEQYKGCPAEVLNLVGDILAKAGIAPNRIKACVRKPSDADATLYLDDGKAALINVEVAYR
jgi:transcriptional regulator with XRE-family HTH domain